MRKSTSDEMYRKIFDMLPDRRAEVWVFVHRHGPVTAKEIEQRMQEDGSDNWRDSNKRLSELECQGVIEACGERVCEVTGNTVTEWAIVWQLPVALKRAKRGKRVFKFMIKDCDTCLLHAIDGDVDCCYLDLNIKCAVIGRAKGCPMEHEFDELIARVI